MGGDVRPSEQPIHGQVYVATGVGPVAEGTAGLFVRTERRPGKDEFPKHLLIVTHGRVVYERWEDPAEFGARWTQSYTPPADPMEAHALRREHHAFRETFREVRDVIAWAVGTRDAGAVSQKAYAKLRERFAEHRAAAQ